MIYRLLLKEVLVKSFEVNACVDKVGCIILTAGFLKVCQ